MAEMTAMPGVMEDSRNFEFLVAAAEKPIRMLREIGLEGRKFFKTFGARVDQMAIIQVAKSLRRCRDLAKEFHVVSRDESIKRQAKGTNGFTVEVPLVFSTNLPAKPFLHFNAQDETGYSVRVTAQTPFPTTRVAKAIKQHGKRFDHLEVWWVPNEVLIEPLPLPDPIL